MKAACSDTSSGDNEVKAMDVKACDDKTGM
jgi:hypothetical protein